MLEIVLATLATVLCIATFLPWWRHDAWWVRAWEFPRPQIAISSAAVLLVYLVFGSPDSTAERALLAALGFCVVFQLYRIRPYTRLAAKQSLPTDGSDSVAKLSLMVANVLMTNRRSDRLLELVRRYSPDVLFTVETDDWWAEQLRVLEDDYPHTVKHPLDNTYGLLLYSRLPLREPEVQFLVEDDVPSVQTRLRLAGGREVRLHCLHPKPPAPQESVETTGRDGELLMVGREIGKRGEPTVLAGDLNDVAWSYTTQLLQKVSGLLDPRIGRGLYSTYNAQNPIMRWPLDHIFHSTHFKLICLDRLPAFGSDHFPVYIELGLEPEAPIEQDEPEAEPEDFELADEKIEQAEPIDEL